MGDHHLNPVARANSVPRETIRVMDLGGDGLVLAGVYLQPVQRQDADGSMHLAVLLMATVGRKSNLVPLQPIAIPLGEVGAAPLDKLREAILKMLDAPAEGNVTQ